MKLKVCAVLFAVILCLGVSFFSLGFVSSASELETTKPVNGDFSLTPEEYKKIQDGLIDMVLGWHGYTYEECALEFFNTMYEMMIVDEFHYSGNPPREYDGNRPMFSSEGVWNPDYVVAYESGQLHIWGFSYSIDEFEEYIAARLAAETAAEDFVPDKSDIKTPISVDVDFFKDVLNKDNNTLTPKNRTMHKYSWRELSDSQATYSADYLARAVGKNGSFLDGVSFEDGIYIQPYVILGDVYKFDVSVRGDYYSPYQYHIYCEKTDSGTDVYPFKYSWYGEALYYQIEDGERLDTHTNLINWYYADYQNISIGMYPNSNYLYIYFYNSLLDCRNRPGSYTSRGYSPGDLDSSDFIKSVYRNFYKSNDTNYYLDFSNISYYFLCGSFSGSTASLNNTLSTFENKCPNDNVSDYGLLVSSEPFTTTYLFDVTRLPSNATVTISGDSIYDYSITDNSTGDTSTIYNYVTNNYTYPDSSGGNTSGGNGGNGGNIGGNITVGGQVDVGGKVDVNVNINNGGNGNNYSMPDTSGMDGFLESALDESTGIRKFLKVFFDFLPPPILALLGVALTCAIIARLLGR